MATTPNQAARRHFSCVMVALALFGLMGLSALTGAGDSIDDALRSGLNSLASPALTRAFTALTSIGSAEATLTMAAALGVVLMFVGQGRAMWRLALVMVAAMIVNHAVKISVARPRPEPFFGAQPESFSFASGHALFSGCFYGFIGLLIASALPHAWQRTLVGVVTVALIGGIGLSRVYLGVHYPSDVVAGFALAASILCTARAIGGEPRLVVGDIK